MQIKEYNHNNLFNCKIIYSPKRKRSLCISVQSDGVLIRVPIRTSDKIILDFVTKKEKLILKQLQKISQTQYMANKSILEREFLHFLGKKYLLQIKRSKLLVRSGFCEINEDSIFVNVPQFEEQKNFTKYLENTIKEWYKKRALEIFNERTNYLASLHNFKYTKIKIGEQKSLWGSCNHLNNLSFNWRVVQCDIDVIDYLIIHELTHTIHRNHSQNFWNKVGEILPNYKEMKKSLNKLKLFSI